MYALLTLWPTTSHIHSSSCESSYHSNYTCAHVTSLKHQVPTTQTVTSNASHEASNDLVRTLAEAITANRVPIPEPEVFKGDPLKYNDWKLSFCTLIDHKNLPTQEKLLFLRKYVGGKAKRAIEGHFLAATETTYCAAWDILEDRFGNPFIIAKSYRDKIHSWHKIGPKDSEHLREFVDFLSSVESAMPYVQGLQSLHDCVENQRIAIKLPDWLSARWNRSVTLYQDEHKNVPRLQILCQISQRGHAPFVREKAILSIDVAK